jgi:hypothetical protein
MSLPLYVNLVFPRPFRLVWPGKWEVMALPPETFVWNGWWITGITFILLVAYTGSRILIRSLSIRQ